MSVTARIYHSQRPDLSSQQWWDYDPSVYDDVAYKKILSVTKDAAAYWSTNGFSLGNKLYKPDIVSGSILLTDEGDSLARRIDKAAYNQYLQGISANKFENKAEAAYINAKINIADLTLGFVSWNKTEGSGTTYTDQFASVSGTVWSPSHKYIYAKYNKPLLQNLLFSAFLNYRIHTIRNGSKVAQLHNYATGGLELKDLVDSTPSYFNTTYYYEQSEQFRSEFKLLYTPSEHFYIIGGVELRNSQLQGYLLTSPNSNPEETGTYTDTLPGGNQFNVNDIGIYIQSQYRTKSDIGFTVGGRLDHNQIRQSGGLGYTFSPRVVIDKIYKTWVFKAIFCKGIEDVSNLTKFSDFGGTLVSNFDLKAESIYNFEFSVSNKISKGVIADIDFYYSNIKNATRSIRIAPVTRQIQNIAEYKILGIQTNLYYSSQKLQASISYSYTYPTETKDTFSISGKLKIASVASNKIDGIVNCIFLKHYNINFRANYVGSKKAGPNTTSQFNEISSFPGYFLGNVAFSIYDIFRLKGTTLQFLCNNIFNKTYYTPGNIGGGGIVSPGSFLQMGRNFSFKINYEF